MHHGSTIKCVRFRPPPGGVSGGTCPLPSLFASCGDDKVSCLPCLTTRLTTRSTTLFDPYKDSCLP